MSSSLRLAVFGATGRTGREVVAQALARGHEVAAFVRDPAKLADQQDPSDARLHVVEGDVRDAEAVARAVEGADAVVSCLAPVPSDGPVQTQGTENIVAAMRRHGVERVVSETGAGVASPADPPPSLGARLMRGVMRLVAGKVLADGEGHAEALRRSGLDYAVVRAPRLTTGPRTGHVRHGTDLALGPGESISRADVAAFMLDEAEGGAYHRAEPFVTGA
ncbi:NAD(P)-dependent oxidoreductase [Rubrivirga marina]|uniref:NAD(P)-binding domain-containing protein n=1 Tax=Rubrivirga marina TaxID=1196024 RepID=A0A271IZY6_9BACT|nr:SDR family oxidoreductase [Rubrivirga marina]PAP76059.1 hypothetical protein BSZ37_06185 [Rubrivirga marina]